MDQFHQHAYVQLVPLYAQSAQLFNHQQYFSPTLPVFSTRSDAY